MIGRLAFFLLLATLALGVCALAFDWRVTIAEDIADAIVWMATRPAHVNVDLLVIKPRAQAAPHKVDRER